MNIKLTDKEVRDAIESYVARRSMHPLEKLMPGAEITILRITRHHGGTVSAEVRVDMPVKADTE